MRRRSNEGLGLRAPIRKLQNQRSQVLGWRSQDLRDGAVTTPELAEPLREAQTAVGRRGGRREHPHAGEGGHRGSEARRRGALHGDLRPRDVSACALQATIADPGTTALTTGGEVGAWCSASDPKIVAVRTADSAGAATNALPFHLTVFC